MDIKKSIGRAFRGLLQPCCAALLIGVYFLGSVEVETLHTISHQEDYTEIHSDENEANPCHISIYHKNIQDGCDHSTHVTKNTKCSFCDTQLHNTHLPFEDVSPSTFISFTTYWVAEDSNSSESFVSYTQGRAPPLA